MSMAIDQLTNIPEDVFLRIAAHLGIDDVLSLRKVWLHYSIWYLCLRIKIQTCSSLYQSTKLKHLWLQFLTRDTTLHKKILRRCKPLADLSSSQLEILARHSAVVRDCFTTQDRPAISVKLDRDSPVTWVHLMDTRWLLSATSDAAVSEISLWRLRSILHEKDDVPLARAFLGGPVADGLVTTRDARVVIALEIRSP